jgi:hypothetical protein
VSAFDLYRAGNTLSVWFDDPSKESVCEEADDDVTLIKDRQGRLIGLNGSTTYRRRSTRKA